MQISIKATDEVKVLDFEGHLDTQTSPDALSLVKDMVQSCVQCGTCTGSCPNAFAMDLTPRHLWRLALMGKTDEIFQSKTFDRCSACYYCTPHVRQRHYNILYLTCRSIQLRQKGGGIILFYPLPFQLVENHLRFFLCPKPVLLFSLRIQLLE